MAAENGQFRGALGGFNRQDVVAYIERTTKEHQKQIADLQSQLEQAQAEKAALTQELEGARSESGDLAGQEAKVRASLEESTRSLTHLRGELQVAQGQLTIAKKQLGDLQEKVAQLEPVAQRYESLKDRVATVELDAHRKAQATIEEAQTQAKATLEQAQAQADAIRRETSEWLSGLSGSYEALREQLNACALRADAVSRDFAAQEETYQELLHRAGLGAPETEAGHE